MGLLINLWFYLCILVLYVWHNKTLCITNLCNLHLTHIVRMNKSHAEICHFGVPVSPSPVTIHMMVMWPYATVHKLDYFICHNQMFSSWTVNNTIGKGCLRLRHAHIVCCHTVMCNNSQAIAIIVTRGYGITKAKRLHVLDLLYTVGHHERQLILYSRKFSLVQIFI